MTYYSLQQSLDVSVMSHLPKGKEILDQGNIPSNLVLPASTLLTDLIYLWDVGFSFTLLISGKLKNILKEHLQHGIQFIQCSVFQNRVAHEDYWLLKMTDPNNDFPGFNKYDRAFKDQKIKQSNGKKKAARKPNQANNFFLLKHPLKYVVSESLKNQIELAGCKGVTFSPVELSLNEWLQDCFFSINLHERALR